MTTDYKTVFQLAQDKGMKKPLVFIDNELYVTSLIQKWLRDKHKLCVSVSPSYESIGFMFEIAKFKTYWYVSDDSFEFIESYESALLTGICEALKLI